MPRPLVLLSNDDGYRAPGIRILRDALREVFDVFVCAPETEQSATSHSLTLNRPMRLIDRGDGFASVDGTPADSVYVALNSGKRVLPRAPDLVVAGLNHGVNLGTDVFYSGTVAAAREGALRGYPSIAFSAARDADMEAAAKVAVRIARQTLTESPGRAVLLNVNFPSGAAWPVHQTRLGERIYTDTVDFRRDPRGAEYLWLGGPGAEHRPDPGSDTNAFDAGEISVTPLVLDLFSASEADLTARVVAGITSVT
jgi:5'-nucleotidase